MTQLGSFRSNINVAVVGASGGIGGAFCRALAVDPSVASVHAFSRTETRFPQGNVTWHALDLEDEHSIELAANVRGDISYELILVLTGILHQGDRLQPERRLEELTPANLARVFAINAIGPAMIAKHFLPRLSGRTKTVFAALSARVGSIGDNRLGGWASYRASKAALNQLLRTIAIEHARRRPQSVVAALHPGTVSTGLSQPFTSRTPADKLFSPAQSAEYLLRVIDGLTPEDSGGFFAWDGSKIEY